MKNYDIIVIGSGAGSIIVENALSAGLKTALVDKGPLGGTCLNVGCIPSKMLVYPADRIMEIREAARLGITADIGTIDFEGIMERMRSKVERGTKSIREGIRRTKSLDFYEGEARFTDEYTLEVNDKKLRGEKIFLATGARPLIPPIENIETVEYLTNETVLRLQKLPDSMAIIGGGDIAVEYAHFFSAMGTDVTVIQRNTRLVPTEDREVSALLLSSLRKRFTVHTDTEVESAERRPEGVLLRARNNATGKPVDVTASAVLIAAGRQSNADTLRLAATGVETGPRGWIRVDDHFETTKKNIWAFGDALGKDMFRHVANRQASIVWKNAVEKKGLTFDSRMAPHAVFTHPQIASVGWTEEQARKELKPDAFVIGKAVYSEVAMGEAMREDEGFAKVLIDRNNGAILGCHIIGPSASMLIQEVINAMAIGADLWTIGKGMHIHPALSELIIAALNNLHPPH